MGQTAEIREIKPNLCTVSHEWRADLRDVNIYKWTVKVCIWEDFKSTVVFVNNSKVNKVMQWLD